MVCKECILQIGADQFVIPIESVLKTFGSKIEMFIDTTSRTDTYTKYVIRRPKDSTMALIEYCYTGQLHIPKSICKGVFLTELKFWGVNHSLLETCCYHKLCAFVNDQKMLKGFENMHKKPENSSAGRNVNAKEKIWGIVNCDRNSTCSKVYFCVSTTFVLMTIAILALTSMNDVQDTGQYPDMTDVQETAHQNMSASAVNLNVSTTLNPLSNISQPTATEDPTTPPGVGNVEPTELIYPPVSIYVNCDPCCHLNGTSPGQIPNRRTNLRVENTDIHLKILECCLFYILQPSAIQANEMVEPPTDYKDSEDVYDVDKSTIPIPDFTYHNYDSAINQTSRLNEMKAFSGFVNVTPHSSFQDMASAIPNTTADHRLSPSNISFEKIKTVKINITADHLSVKVKLSDFVLNTVLNSKEKLYSFASSLKLNSITYLENVICYYMEYVLMAFFSVEFVLRLITCPIKKEFLSGVLNWLDLILLLGSFGRILLDLRSDLMETMTVVYDLLLYLQMFRVFRLFRTIEHIKAFKVLRYSLVTGMKDICVLGMYVMVTMCLFSNFIYFVENKSDFPSIPAAWWWSIVTMTTVGYGDMVPKTVLGKLIGCICALSGVVLFSLIIPVFVTTFLNAYEYANGSLDDDQWNDDSKKRISISLCNVEHESPECQEREICGLCDIEVNCIGHKEHTRNTIELGISNGNLQQKSVKENQETICI
ncbi:potassium voltage-gated channel subfamily B member 2-like [Pecten maximus]|uniref:potassium voltage-gated channel subfamily B member 2-like n=1 Tax=Pecten maximus TaxID=6579 RepID=UPI0014585A1A|nr:potassium voltage-gated channel subfamily B member 2-like [Pecten maximus]